MSADVGTELRAIVASYWVENVISRVSVTAGALALLHGEVLDVRGPEDVSVRFDAQGQPVAVAFARAGVAPSEDHGVIPALRRVLVDTLARPLAVAVRPHGRRPESAFLQIALDGINSGLTWAGEEIGDPDAGDQLARAVLEPSGLWRGPAGTRWVTGEDGEEERLRIRLGCCLGFRREDGLYCAGCPIAPTAQPAG